ncbi:hypothetical protein HanPI659440_Chr17g0686971 [Helianthus annuus]|nr:hypothetical protein HanPI659440_Chr17g0686971 [Helianthus annuus]
MIPSLFTSHHRLFYNEELKEIDYNELSQLKLITAPTFQAHHHHHPTSTTTTSPWLRTTMATAPGTDFSASLSLPHRNHPPPSSFNPQEQI